MAADVTFAVAVVSAADFLVLEEAFPSFPLHDLGGFDLGYFVFPVFLFSVLFVVYAHSWPTIREAWKERRRRRISLLAGAGFAAFYVFATNMVSMLDPGTPLPPFGFVVPSVVYGPMAMWPDVEFWFPKAGFFGYFSIGTVLLLITLGVLASFAVGLLIQGITLRGGGRPGRGAVGPLGGAFAVTLFTNACCCCAPLLLPLVSALAGATAAASLQYSVLVPGSALSDLLAIVNPALLLVGILVSARGNRACLVARA